jgi:restriction system protein
LEAIGFIVLRWVIPSVFAASYVLAAPGTISKSIAWLAACGFGLIALISLFLNKRSEPQAFKFQKQKKQKTVREAPSFKINAPDECANGATPASSSPRCYYSFLHTSMEH